VVAGKGPSISKARNSAWEIFNTAAHFAASSFPLLPPLLLLLLPLAALALTTPPVGIIHSLCRRCGSLRTGGHSTEDEEEEEEEEGLLDVLVFALFDTALEIFAEDDCGDAAGLVEEELFGFPTEYRELIRL